MELTRKALKAMGCSEEQVDTIAEAHGDQVMSLKNEINALKAKYADYDDVKKERDDLKNNGENYKTKYEKEHADFEDYKKSVTERDEKTAKEAAAKAYFEGKGISGNNLNIAMRGARDEINALELKDGKIADSAALDELVGGTFAGLVTTRETRGANMATPPDVGGSTLTKEQILDIEDDDERQKAIYEHIELFN